MRAFGFTRGKLFPIVKIKKPRNIEEGQKGKQILVKEQENMKKRKL